MHAIAMYAPEHFPDVRPRVDLPALIIDVLRDSSLFPQDGDILVVAQKVVSKAEGRIVDLREVVPSPRALALAAEAERDPRLVEVILREARTILRVRPGLIIAEHRLGFICANAGVDHSNIGLGEDVVTLLPSDPDASARSIKQAVDSAFRTHVAVIINDSHGRPFREGAVGVCIGVAGIEPLRSYVGKVDRYGYVLRTSVEAIADEVASAATLLMGQADEGRPLVLIRGVTFARGEGSARALLRDPSRDLFR